MVVVVESAITTPPYLLECSVLFLSIRRLYTDLATLEQLLELLHTTLHLR